LAGTRAALPAAALVSGQHLHQPSQGEPGCRREELPQVRGFNDFKVNVTGDVKRYLFEFNGPLHASFSGAGSAGFETESIQFNRTYDSGSQTLTGTLDRAYTERPYNKVTHRFETLHWMTETPVEIVPEIIT
jgi:hypothetical protein